MAEGAGTSQSPDYQRAVESLAKRDDGASFTASSKAVRAIR